MLTLSLRFFVTWLWPPLRPCHHISKIFFLPLRRSLGLLLFLGTLSGETLPDPSVTSLFALWSSVSCGPHQNWSPALKLPGRIMVCTSSQTWRSKLPHRVYALSKQRESLWDRWSAETLSLAPDSLRTRKASWPLVCAQYPEQWWLQSEPPVFLQTIGQSLLCCLSLHKTMTSTYRVANWCQIYQLVIQPNSSIILVILYIPSAGITTECYLPCLF